MTETLNVGERLKFGAEVGKVLNLVIHSLYTNKDIFLRELVSNASDACDKLRYNSLSDPNLVSDSELKIVISANKESKSLVIADNGIGMNRQDLIDNLGTIAHSGTQRFLEALKCSKDKENAVELIGKFGVGFYSSFMVASEVIVESRKAGDSTAWVWRSSGDGDFEISVAQTEIERGTKITLVLKDEETDFLDRFRIESIVTTYSDHINYPIEFVNEKGENERLNSKSAIWVRPKDEISNSEHLEFYRSVAHVGGEPWMILHNKNEGSVEFTNLLYIPSMKPFDLFHPDRRCSIKLYVNKVFITEDNVQIIPQYMRFLRGVIDSPDLPLNISRETVQNNRVIDKIKKSLVKRVLTELKKKSLENAEEYKKFWDSFGSVLKEGLCEAMNTESREELMSVCKFYSTHCSDDNLISLEDYITRMNGEQEFIYYLTGGDLSSIRRSPQLEGFKSSGVEVLLLTDPVDDFWTNVVNEYKGKKLKSVTRSGEDLDKLLKKGTNNEGDDSESSSDDFSSLISYFSKILDKSVSEVRISKKLTDSPVCLAIGDASMDIRMERFLREQKQLNYKSAKILEVNQKHPLIIKIAEEYKKNGEKIILEDIVHLLFNQACLLEGEELPDVNDFVQKMNNVLKKLYEV